MAMRDVRNVKVVFLGNEAGLLWEYEGCCYHCIIDSPKVLYKNPAAGIDRFDKGFFATRRLHPHTPNNRALIDSARAVADRLNLLELAKQKIEDERKAEQERLAEQRVQKFRADQAIHRLKEWLSENPSASMVSITKSEARALIYQFPDEDEE